MKRYTSPGFFFPALPDKYPIVFAPRSSYEHHPGRGLHWPFNKPWARSPPLLQVGEELRPARRFSQSLAIFLPFLIYCITPKPLFIKCLQYKMPERGRTAAFVPCLVFVLCYNCRRNRRNRRISFCTALWNFSSLQNGKKGDSAGWKW